MPHYLTWRAAGYSLCSWLGWWRLWTLRLGWARTPARWSTKDQPYPRWSLWNPPGSWRTPPPHCLSGSWCPPPRTPAAQTCHGPRWKRMRGFNFFFKSESRVYVAKNKKVQNFVERINKSKLETCHGPRWKRKRGFIFPKSESRVYVAKNKKVQNFTEWPNKSKFETFKQQIHRGKDIKWCMTVSVVHRHWKWRMSVFLSTHCWQLTQQWQNNYTNVTMLEFF